jgi:hypothetical protein
LEALVAAEIQLANGYTALIDEADLSIVSPHRWRGIRNLNHVYVLANISGKTERLHRFLMGLKHGEKLVVDHINGNTLDNRRSNLKVCTYSENNLNRRKQENAKSRYKGVHPCPNGEWTSYVMTLQADGPRKKIYLGTFGNEARAAAAYNRYYRKVRGLTPNNLRYGEEINSLLDQKEEIERQIESLCEMEAEQS